MRNAVQGLFPTGYKQTKSPPSTSLVFSCGQQTTDGEGETNTVEKIAKWGAISSLPLQYTPAI